jgi:hypothetical protein
MPKCKVCKDTGWYAYDENHSKVCDACCKHDQGWWELTEGYMGYKKGMDNACCRAGCGTMRRDLKKGESNAIRRKRTH